jgi:hypothetical protein
MENKMKSSATAMMEEPLMMPSQPPIFAERKIESLNVPT